MRVVIVPGPQLQDRVFLVPVTWSMTADVVVVAGSAEKASAKVQRERRADLVRLEQRFVRESFDGPYVFHTPMEADPAVLLEHGDKVLR